MNELFTAIYTYFTSDVLAPFYVGIGGRLYLKKAPQEATFPYCVYFMVTDDEDDDFTDNREDIEIQFNIFSENNSSLEAGQLLGSLKTMFDDSNFDVSGWNLLMFRRRQVLENDDFSQVPPIYGYSAMYDIILEKQRNC